MINHSRNYKKHIFLENSGVTSDPQEFEGGTGIVMISGTIGGSTVLVEYKEDSGGWIPFPVPSDVDDTKAHTYQIEAPPGMLRVSVSGGSSPKIWATIYRRYAV